MDGAPRCSDDLNGYSGRISHARENFHQTLTAVQHFWSTLLANMHFSKTRHERSRYIPALISLAKVIRVRNS